VRGREDQGNQVRLLSRCCVIKGVG
jgi:hypothetical protein